MENKDIFKMTYSAEQQDEINQIRRRYMPKEESKLERLRALDAAVGKKAAILSIVIGVIGTLIMGVGMSMVMTDFGNIFGNYSFFIGIVTGVAGIVILAAAYPLYNHKLKKEREKIAPEILRLTDELLK